jgi:sugar-specific transcriptional regulator TrmB
MDIKKELKKIGLHESDIGVYMYLLENGLSYPAQISKGTEVSRTNTYNVLRRLEEKGLIEKQKKRNKKAYLAKNPESLFRTIERKKERAEKILPNLKAMYNKKKNKPTIRFYDGVEQVKDLFEQCLEADEIFAIGSTNNMHNLDPDFFDRWLRKLKEENIIINDVLTYASKESTEDQIKEELSKLHDVTYLPKKYEDVPTDILIWGDNIGVIHYDKPVFGTIITNEKLAQTFKILFKTLTEWAPEKNKKGIETKMKNKLNR